MITFFDVIDQIWDIRGVPLRYGTIFLKDPWLCIVARILSDHREFWNNDTELIVHKPWITAFKRIPSGDPDYINMARGNKKHREMLHAIFLGLLNQGKTTNRLVDRYTLEKAERQSRFNYGEGDPAHP